MQSLNIASALTNTKSEAEGTSTHVTNISPSALYTRVQAWKRARSLARIKVSAFGAGDRGFKSHRARFHFRLEHVQLGKF
jgi:hypothetical protein